MKKKHTVKEFFYDTRFTDYKVGEFFKLGPSRQRKIVAITIFLVLFIFNICSAFYLFELNESVRTIWKLIGEDGESSKMILPILKITFAKGFVLFNLELIKQIVTYFLYNKKIFPFTRTRSGGMR